MDLTCTSKVQALIDQLNQCMQISPKRNVKSNNPDGLA